MYLTGVLFCPFRANKRRVELLECVKFIGLLGADIKRAVDS